MNWAAAGWTLPVETQQGSSKGWIISAASAIEAHLYNVTGLWFTFVTSPSKDISAEYIQVQKLSTTKTNLIFTFTLFSSFCDLSQAENIISTHQQTILSSLTSNKDSLVETAGTFYMLQACMQGNCL